MSVLIIEHIVATPGTCGGKPRIAGTRMRVEDVSINYNAGMTVEEICDQFTLTPGQVYAALSYYFDHKDEIEADLREEIELADKYMSAPNAITSEELEAQINARQKK